MEEKRKDKSVEVKAKTLNVGTLTGNGATRQEDKRKVHGHSEGGHVRGWCDRVRCRQQNEMESAVATPKGSS